MARNDMPFQFEVPIDFFEKADAPAGKQRRIGGLVSTENPDRQGEVILQQGLDFSDFLKHGWYNDNHSKETDGILGYPEAVKFIQKGDRLPNGQSAPADGHWAEGYLLDTDKGRKIWELGKALAKTNRRLGFSVEGGIQRRTGPLRKTIAQARVRNVAITNCPVNTDSRLDLLSKSLLAAERQGDDKDELVRAVTMGPATPGVAPQGSITGEGSGRVIAQQSLESKDNPPQELEDDEIEELKKPKTAEAKKSMDAAEANVWLRTRLPGLTIAQANRVFKATLKLVGK